MSDQPIHFDVQLSEPYEYEVNNGQGGKRMIPSRRNQQLDIITTSAARAIELALERHPEGQVHVVQRRGSSNLIIDPNVWL
jgi:hypothetical protein